MFAHLRLVPFHALCGSRSGSAQEKQCNLSGPRTAKLIGGDARYGVSVTIHGFWRFFGAGRHWDRRFDGSEKRSTRIGDLK